MGFSWGVCVLPVTLYVCMWVNRVLPVTLYVCGSTGEPPDWQRRVGTSKLPVLLCYC